MPGILTDVQLILWDIDGTLLWPHGSGRASTRLAMLEVFKTEAGIDTHHFGGKTDWRTLLDLLPPHGFTGDDITRLMPSYEDAAARHLAAVINDYPVEPCPGAHAVIAELRRRDHLLQGILTGNVSTTAPIKLRAAGYDPAWFPIAAYGSEAPDRNHLPFIALERASAHLGRPIQPHQVVIVGDTLADIACARALGAVAVAVKTGYATNQDELAAAQPDYLLDDLTTFLGQVLPA